MTMETDEFESRVIAMLGVHLTDGKKDFGVILEYFVVTENKARQYVFVTNTGREIDARSAMRFMNGVRRRSTQSTPIAFPDGTDAALRRRLMRVQRHGSRSIGGYVSTTATVGNQRIDISSTVTSAGAFPEEYTDGRNK